MNNINVIRKPSSREGEANPMWGRHHSDETKRKQSEAAKKRWAEVKKMQSIHHITMDELLSNEAFTAYIDRIITEQISNIIR